MGGPWAAKSAKAEVVRAGFTGSRSGMKDRQRNSVAGILATKGVTELHHGGCIGADEEVHRLALAWDIRVHLHPGPPGPMRAECLGAESIVGSKPFLIRNRDIVFVTEFLIAAPSEKQEKLRSGTWSTIRFARKVGRPVFIVYPDGTIGEERTDANQ